MQMCSKEAGHNLPKKPAYVLYFAHQHDLQYTKTIAKPMQADKQLILKKDWKK